MNPARNALCPCGSGRKYKRCCLKLTDGVVRWGAAIRRVQRGLEQRLFDWAFKEFGPEGMKAALVDFTFGKFDFGPSDPEAQLFEPWFLYDWQTRARGGRKGRSGRSGSHTIAELFQMWEGANLDQAERDYLESVTAEPHSFYDVVRSDPGKRMTLRDILRGGEREVVEHSASRVVSSGDILYARVVSFPGAALMIGAGSILMPPTSKKRILELRRLLRDNVGDLDQAALRVFGEETRRLYVILRGRLLDPPLPVLANTDGDPLEPHEMTYRIESAAEAFHALKSLDVVTPEEELTRRARLDGKGMIKEVEIGWFMHGNKTQTGWDNTSLGRIHIEGERMTVSVNSAPRAARIEAEIEKRLGARAQLIDSAVTSMKDALANLGHKSPAEARRRSRESRELGDRPEVQEAVRGFLNSQWESWPEQPLPALDGRTPLDAVCEPEGREMVEALLCEAERREKRKPLAGVPFDFAPLRRRLGLEPPG